MGVCCYEYPLYLNLLIINKTINITHVGDENMRYLAPIIEVNVGVIAIFVGYFLYITSGPLYWYGWLIIGSLMIAGISFGLYGLFTGIESAVTTVKE